MTEVSIYKAIIETKVKIERCKRFFASYIPKLKKNFLNFTGMTEKQWVVIYNHPPIKGDDDLEDLIDALYQ